MYPSQTSLIPATVALIRYIESNGFGGNYPYWYLGSTPTKFLIGPIIPYITIFIKNIAINVSFFNILIYLIIVSYILSSLAWGILIYKITKNKLISIVTVIIYFLLPGKYFVGFGLEEGTFILAKNLLPFFFLFIYQRKKILSILSLSFLLLINTSILTQVLVGVGALSLNFKVFKRNVFYIICSLILVTYWYSPQYWIVVLFNPSIGGLSLGKLALRIFELARNFLPILLAFFVVRVGKIKRSNIERFGLIWFGIFTFLTIYRFIADYDFWIDWTAWLPELEIGFAIFIANSIFEKKYKWVLILSSILLIPTFIIIKNLKFNTLITKNPPEIMKSLIELDKISKGQTVFISGTTTFWANAFFDIKQVRGGRDQYAIHPTWDKGSYELREGENASNSDKWLELLDIKYVLVHGEDSTEYYHDFKNISKWYRLGRKVYEDNGDFILKI